MKLREFFFKGVMLFFLIMWGITGNKIFCYSTLFVLIVNILIGL